MEEKILAIISKISSKKHVGLDDNFIYSYGFDSKKVMQLILKVESEFDISIREEDLDIDNFNNVKSIIALVEKYQAAQ